jgi:GT2 family glycosyltransferase
MANNRLPDLTPHPGPLPQGEREITFLLSTFNRREVTLHTIERLQHCGLSPDDYEIIVVDNASSDGTAYAIETLFPEVHLIALDFNKGPCAKNLGIGVARGKYIVFLDDDSFPDARSVAKMLHHFAHDPSLGAAVFTVTLPDGSRECSAYPDVFIGCGTGFRREALLQVGGLPEDFFMQAEEYDLSLRLLEAGWHVRTFHDLHVSHLKTPGARFSQRVTRFDVRNNLALIGKHFPDEWVLPFAWDWAKRYYAIAAAKGHRVAFFHGLAEGIVRLVRPEDRKPVAPETFEIFAKIAQTNDKLAKVKRDFGLKRVLFVDLGKNMLPYYRAAMESDLKIEAVADNRLCQTARSYRGIPVMNDLSALRLNFDAAIVSNLSPVHAALRKNQWQRMTDKPVINLFETAA